MGNRARKTGLLLLFAVLMLGMLHAADPLSDPFRFRELFGDAKIVTCNQPADDLGWAKLTLVALFLGIAITSFGWIASGVFSHQKMTEFLKAKLWGILEVSVILCLFSASFIALRGFGEENIDTARTYSTIVKNTAMMDFVLVFGASTLFSFVANQAPQYKFPGLEGTYLSIQLAPMFRPIFDALNIMSQLITTAVVEWTAHEMLLCFIKNSMLTLLLPAGIFLRAIGIKGGGNALIGLAFSLYFVYPWMMIMTGQIVSQHFENDIKIANAPHVWITCMDKPICCIPFAPHPANFTEPFIPNGKNWQTDLSYRLSQQDVLEGSVHITMDGTAITPGVNAKAFCIYNTQLAQTFKSASDFIKTAGIWTVVIGTGVLAVMMDIFNLSFLSVLLIPPMTAFALSATYEAVFYLFIVSLVLPIFTIFITLTLAREIARALGTEIDLSALEKII